MSNLKIIDKKIDELWHSGLNNNKNHIFFENIETAKNISKRYIHSIKKQLNIELVNDTDCNNNTTFPKVRVLKDKKIIYKDKLLKKDILNFFKIIKKKHPRNFIENEFYKIKNKMLPSNINLSNYLESIKNNGKKKILIIGSGPNGLFNALYLKKLYGNKIDILTIDNRIVKEGFREPFTRDRSFSYSTDLLTILYKYLYCGDNKNGYDGGKINYIEYLGYFQILKQRLPIYFTKKYEKWNNIQKLMKTYNFKIIFDCTGNRLNAPVIETNVNNYKKKLSKIENKNFKLNIKNNEVILNPKNKDNHIINIFTLKFFDKLKNYISYIDLYTNYKCDILLYKFLNQKLISKKDIKENVVNLIKYTIDKKIIKNNLKKDNIHYFKFNLNKVNMHHKIKISKIYNYKDHEFLYIGNGDTIFHSHYLKGAGLNNIISFITKVLYLVNMYYN